MERSVLLTSDSRIFIKDKTNCCVAEYTYHSCMRLDGLDKSFGDISSEYCPDPDKYRRFIEVATIRGQEDRATTSLVGRLPRKVRSKLDAMGKARCTFDLQLHYGFCGNPSDFNEYEIGLVLENIRITNYSTDQLGALSFDENASILETVQLSVGNFYYVARLNIANTTAQFGPNLQIIDITVCNRPNCYQCENCSCAIYAIGFRTGDTTLTLFSSLDDGLTWIEELTIIPIPVLTTEFPDVLLSNIMCFGNNLYITTSYDNGLGNIFGIIYSIDILDALDGGGITQTVVYDGQLSPNPLSTLFANRLILFQDNFYTIQIENVSGGENFIRVIYLDGSNSHTTVYTPPNLAANDRLIANTLQQYNNQIIMAGHRPLDPTFTPEFVYSFNGADWISQSLNIFDTLPITIPPYVTGDTAPFPINSQNWLIFVNQYGEFPCRSLLFCTDDGGKSFSFIGIFPGGCGMRVSYNPTSNVLYAVGSELINPFNGEDDDPGKVWRSIDAGHTWTLLPETDDITLNYDTRTFNAGDRVYNNYRQVHGCKNDPNLVYSPSIQGVLRFS